MKDYCGEIAFLKAGCYRLMSADAQTRLLFLPKPHAKAVKNKHPVKVQVMDQKPSVMVVKLLESMVCEGLKRLHKGRFMYVHPSYLRVPLVMK